MDPVSRTEVIHWKFETLSVSSSGNSWIKGLFTWRDCDCDFLSQQIGCMGFNITVQMVWLQQWHQIPCNLLAALNKAQSQSGSVNGPLHLKHCLHVFEMASLESLVSGSGDHLRKLTVTHATKTYPEICTLWTFKQQLALEIGVCCEISIVHL